MTKFITKTVLNIVKTLTYWLTPTVQQCCPTPRIIIMQIRWHDLVQKRIFQVKRVAHKAQFGSLFDFTLERTATNV